MSADTGATRIVCIVPRLGASVGGGKMNAVFRRMNLLCDRPETQVVLLNLQHGVNQKILFADLKAQGVFDPRVRHASLYEFCAADADIQTTPITLPDWDHHTEKTARKTRRVYHHGNTVVMKDVSEETSAGRLTIRHVLSDANQDIRLKYLDDHLVERVTRHGDGITDKDAFVNDALICQTRLEHRAFCYADHAHLGTRYRYENNLQKELVSRHFPKNCVVFVDGITTAYLSRHIDGSKVLFLHADHRAPGGAVVPRSRYLIENFDGDAIITATHVHKARLEKETNHAAPIRVIPHYIRPRDEGAGARQHICTVSRLELEGKPIHQCIEAFTRVMHKIPDCNYLIYGSGLGEARLRQLIHHKKCEDRVFLMGFTENARRVFSQSRLSLAPTMTEGFGLALLESLASGCPVVSYDVDYGPRELIRNNVNGQLVTPSDIDGIADAILRVLAHENSYARGCADTAQRYSFEAYRANYADLLNDLLGTSYFFDIRSAALRDEITAALKHAPQRHKARLLDLAIKLAETDRDLDAMYRAFDEKRQLFPHMQRPLMRCIWLSRRLGRLDECRSHLERFAQRFPVNHAQFLQRYPDFLNLELV